MSHFFKRSNAYVKLICTLTHLYYFCSYTYVLCLGIKNASWLSYPLLLQWHWWLVIRRIGLRAVFPSMIPGGRLPVQFANAGLKNFVKGFPSYRLRTDLGTEGRSLVSLFLKACRAEPNFVNMFMEWLPNNMHVEPVNVLDVLQDFEESSPENKAVAEQLKSNVNCSGWKCIPCLLI